MKKTSVPLDVKIAEGKRLAACLIFAGISNEAQFARTAGISKSGALIYQHKKGITAISLDAALAYSKVLGVPISDFSERLAKQQESIVKTSAASGYTDPEHLEAAGLIASQSLNFTFAPLLTWVRAGDFCRSPDAFTLQDGEELLPVPIGCGKNTYALEVKGDSMDVPGGYHPGDIIFVDPDSSVETGDDVVAMDSEGLTLKRYKLDERGKPYLLQLNGNKIIEPTGEWHVCGRVIFSARKR
ncbi:S24 family peptidase [Flavobacterium sp.]|jgi:SOS-response transcriptional repressor LexA|uniref:S24 family peptidase n=1 Tax=Flavobacterium sp. TaxID=239 RepID=UPI0037BEA85D